MSANLNLKVKETQHMQRLLTDLSYAISNDVLKSDIEAYLSYDERSVLMEANSILRRLRAKV